MPESTLAKLQKNYQNYTFPGFLLLGALFRLNPVVCLSAGLLLPYVLARLKLHGQMTPDSVVETTHKLYSSFPKHGKPRVRDNGVAEWTIIASISLAKDGRVIPISVGTGVKCLPAQRLPPLGDTLHDCHAEVLARRGFVRWLLFEAERVLAGEPNEGVLNWDGKKFTMSGAEAWLYVSALPCGDASTLHTALHQDEEMREAFNRAPEFTETGDGAVRGRRGYETYGAIRTKPGRADSQASVSFSCSDKIALWNALGLQGGLLSSLFAPIYLDHIVIGGVTPPKDAGSEQYDAAIVQEAERALFGRIADAEGARLPKVQLTEIPFEYSKSGIEKGAAIATSPISMAAVPALGKNEVLVDGCVQSSAWKAPGTTLVKDKMRSRLSKIELLCAYVGLLGKVNPEEKLTATTYYDLKDPAFRARKAAVRGQVAAGVSPEWQRLLKNADAFGTTAGDAPFRGWIVAGRRFESFTSEGELVL